MTNEKTIRSFLALDPPGEIRREIGRIQDRLRKLIHGDIRWVKPESIHLTLKFFGDIREGDIANISAVAGKAAASAGPFDFALGGAGVFPDMKRPRIVWLGMTGETARLAAFQKELERALQEIGFPREERPFRPHLTLARVKSPQGLTGLAEAFKKVETDTAQKFTVSAFNLFKSDLTPQGAIYTRLAEYPFGQKGV
ncbi:MAG: RNA 2',3'-cyclic phosphodiesterase [Deltaproteobacteria bacterium]|nr:RNA 2',3'-cyclic phosphodiesterase [Deltaproteobacteria bacterium]